MSMRCIAGLAIAVLLAGCTSDDGSREPEASANRVEAASAARVVACDLLPGEEVAAVLGGRLTNRDPREIEGSSDGARYLSMCTYSVEGGGVLKTLTLMVKRTPEVQDPAAALGQHVEGIRGEMPDYRLEPVGEYGAGAGWNPELLTLTVFRPGWNVEVVTDQRAAAPGLEGARALMTKVLERLP